MIVALHIGAVGIGLRRGGRGKLWNHQRSHTDDQQQELQRCARLACRTPTLLHHSFNMLNCCHCLFIYLIHISLRIARSETYELTLVNSTDEIVNNLGVNAAFLKLAGHVVVRQLLHRNVQLVAHIAPKGAQHLIVEGTGLVLLHQGGCLTQSLGSHLVSTLAATLHQVGILDGTLTENQEKRHERHKEHQHGYPITRTAEEEVTVLLLLHVAKLNVTDILGQQLHILLIREVLNGVATTLALGHFQVEIIRTHRLILLGCSIVIYELDSRNVILTLMAWNGKELVDHRTLDTVCRQLRLVGLLGIVGIEILRELHHGLLNQLQVANATYHNA